MKIFVWAFLVVGLASGFYWKRASIYSEADLTLSEPATVAGRVAQYGEIVALRLKPDFARAGVAYPPGRVTLVVLKQERRLEVYAQNPGTGSNPKSAWHFIRAYPILAASGELGPKLREGDEQVPEGIYAVESLNPNSHYHLALHVDYPNAFDRAEAKAESRTDLGGDIMIHGSDVSIGCVAMGDPAAEDLFVLTAKTGLPKVRLLFCPFDFRAAQQPAADAGLPAWTTQLYATLEKNLKTLPQPPSNRSHE